MRRCALSNLSADLIPACAVACFLAFGGLGICLLYIVPLVSFKFSPLSFGVVADEPPDQMTQLVTYTASSHCSWTHPISVGSGLHHCCLVISCSIGLTAPCASYWAATQSADPTHVCDHAESFAPHPYWLYICPSMVLATIGIDISFNCDPIFFTQPSEASARLPQRHHQHQLTPRHRLFLALSDITLLSLQSSRSSSRSYSREITGKSYRSRVLVRVGNQSRCILICIAFVQLAYKSDLTADEKTLNAGSGLGSRCASSIRRWCFPLASTEASNPQWHGDSLAIAKRLQQSQICRTDRKYGCHIIRKDGCCRGRTLPLIPENVHVATEVC